MDETGPSGRAKQRGFSQQEVTYCPQFGDIIYILLRHRVCHLHVVMRLSYISCKAISTMYGYLFFNWD